MLQSAEFDKLSQHFRTRLPRCGSTASQQPMSPVSESPAESGFRPGSPRERAVSAVLSAAIIIAVLVLAIWQTGVVDAIRKRDALVSFDVVDRGAQKAAGAKRKEPQKAERKNPEKHKPAVAEVQPVDPKIETAAEKPAFSFIKISRADMAAGDIGKMKPSSGGRCKNEIWRQRGLRSGRRAGRRGAS